MNIPQAAIDALPFGYEIKVGDGVWVKPKGCMYWEETNNPRWVEATTYPVSSAGGYYALPVTLDGYELVKVGEVIPKDAKCAVKATGEGSVSYCAGYKVEACDLCWYFRPLAVPAPAPVEPVSVFEQDYDKRCMAISDVGFICTRTKGHEGDHVAHGFDRKPVHTWPQASPPLTMPVVEPVKCPYCGASVSVKFDDGRAYGACFDCDYTTPTRDSTAEIVAIVKRTKVEPEPLTCPCGDAKCGIQPFSINPDAWHMESACGIRGKRMPTKAQAESEFRKLRYEGGGK